MEFAIGSKPKSKSSKKKSKAKGNQKPHELVVFENSIGKKPFAKMDVCRFPGRGFPDQLRCTLRYSDFGVQFTGSISPAAQVYRGNSLFDPDLTGSGSQPEYFDQLSAVYLQYCVQACRIKAQVFNTGTTSNACVMTYSDANTATQSAENLSESRFATSQIVGAKGGMDTKVMSLPPILVSTIQGEKHLNTDPNNYQGIGINPVDPVFIIFRTTSMDNATNSNLYVNFEIEYDAWFKELTPVAESKKKNKNKVTGPKPPENVNVVVLENGKETRVVSDDEYKQFFAWRKHQLVTGK